MHKLVFIDFDGVGNGHQRHDNGFCSLEKENVRCINRILATDADIQLVITSSWRYWVHSGKMTMEGFSEVLQVLGLNCPGRIHGITVSEEDLVGKRDHEWLKENGCQLRAIQIHRYILLHHGFDDVRYVVIDDLKLPVDPRYFVQTDGLRGLTDADTDKAIEILVGHEANGTTDTAA